MEAIHAKVGEAVPGDTAGQADIRWFMNLEPQTTSIKDLYLAPLPLYSVCIWTES